MYLFFMNKFKLNIYKIIKVIIDNKLLVKCGYKYTKYMYSKKIIDKTKCINKKQYSTK